MRASQPVGKTSAPAEERRQIGDGIVRLAETVCGIVHLRRAEALEWREGSQLEASCRRVAGTSRSRSRGSCREVEVEGERVVVSRSSVRSIQFDADRVSLYSLAPGRLWTSGRLARVLTSCCSIYSAALTWAICWKLSSFGAPLGRCCCRLGARVLLVCSLCAAWRAGRACVRAGPAKTRHRGAQGDLRRPKQETSAPTTCPPPLHGGSPSLLMAGPRLLLVWPAALRN